jgi:uncharacterized membrane protein YGL010W
MLHEYLIRSFAFYSRYHRNRTNQIIHQITIPLIVWTVALLVGYWNFYTVPKPLTYLSINAALIPLCFYTVAYFLFDVPMALVAAPAFCGIYILANLFREYVPYAWAYGIGIHVLAWIFQFMGHGVFEGNRPALLDSLGQAFLMAPAFVILELMFMLGLRKDLQAELSLMEQLL